MRGRSRSSAGAGIAFGIIYTVFYVGLNLFYVGGGEGTFLFAAPLLSWPLIWAALIALAYPGKDFDRRMAIVCLVAHYALTIILATYIEAAWDWHYTKKYFSSNAGFCLFGLAWYFGGQVIIWSQFRSTSGIK